MRLTHTPLTPPTPVCILIMQLPTGTPTLICTRMRALISRALPILIKVSQPQPSHDKKMMSRRCILTLTPQQHTTARLLMAMLVATQAWPTIRCTPCTTRTVITRITPTPPCLCILRIVYTQAVTIRTR